jgi:chromosome partitioning protein
MKTIATINFKGGVGKTTVMWCLGDFLSSHSKSNVLLFDLDAQMSLTQSIALDAEGNSSEKFASWSESSITHGRTIFSVLMKFLETDLTGFQADNGFIFHLSQNYHFVPSSVQLYWLELTAPDPEKGKFFIKNLHCPPSFTMLSYSVLTCYDLILIPFIPDFFAANGVGLLIGGLRERIQPHPVPKLAVFANRVRTYRREPTRLARGGLQTCTRNANV